MNVCWKQGLRPGEALQGIVTEAIESLLAMDADRLEELSRCCADLNRELGTGSERTEAGQELAERAHEMEMLRRILFETRANLAVMTRVRLMRLGAESGVLGGALPAGWMRRGGDVEYGDN